MKSKQACLGPPAIKVNARKKRGKRSMWRYLPSKCPESSEPSPWGNADSGPSEINPFVNARVGFHEYARTHSVPRPLEAGKPRVVQCKPPAWTHSHPPALPRDTRENRWPEPQAKLHCQSRRPTRQDHISTALSRGFSSRHPTINQSNQQQQQVRMVRSPDKNHTAQSNDTRRRSSQYRRRRTGSTPPQEHPRPTLRARWGNRPRQLPKPKRATQRPERTARRYKNPRDKGVQVNCVDDPIDTDDDDQPDPHGGSARVGGNVPRTGHDKQRDATADTSSPNKSSHVRMVEASKTVTRGNRTCSSRLACHRQSRHT